MKALVAKRGVHKGLAIKKSRTLTLYVAKRKKPAKKLEWPEPELHPFEAPHALA